ncbi:N-acetylglucosamine-specific PTS transporter subunit IIBC [Aerococcaceae bacterium 50-4]
MKNYLQNLGKSIMLPVSILPVASLLMGIGYWIDPAGLSGEGTNLSAIFLIQAGNAIIHNLPILFSVGIATGLSKDGNGAAGLSGLVGYLIVTNLLSLEGLSILMNMPVEEVPMAFDATENVFMAIIAGSVAAALYNRYSGTKLPTALAFFSGRRLIPILSAAAMLVISLLLFFVWPFAYDALVAFGTFISGLGALGAGLYGFFNKLLIPTGLHHALNSVFWFDLIGINDIGNFWASEGVKGVTGMYQAGFFPIMMFGLPGAALAIFKNAESKAKKIAAGTMIAGAFASFFTGITEPIEFSFMFAAPGLYLVHAFLTGVSMFIAATFHWTAGFGFSAGLVDFMLSLNVPIANQPLMLLVLGLGMFVVYYFVFDFAIRKFDFATPGRGENAVTEEAITDTDSEMTTGNTATPASTSNDKYARMASVIYDAVGGQENIRSYYNCATRLRFELDDVDQVDQARIKGLGVPGVNVLDKNHLHVIVGTDVQFVADEMKKIED